MKNLLSLLFLTMVVPERVLHAQESPPASIDKVDQDTETITIQGQRSAAESQIGVLGARPPFDAPFTVNSYSRKFMENQQSATVNHVLRNDPALTNVSTTGGFSGVSLGFRGFPVGADAVSFNGLGPGAMFSGSLAQLYSIERMDVIKGPSAALGGFGPSASVGGSVNLVSKRPTLNPLSHIAVGLREKGIVSGHVDLSRRFDVGRPLGVRLNLAAEKGEAFHGGQDEREVAALALNYQVSERARMNLGYDAVHIRSEGYQNAYVLAPGVKLPKPPDPNQNHFQKWSFLEQEWNYGYGSFEWELAENWSLTLDGIYGERRRPILSTGTGFITSETGDMTLRPSYLASGTRYAPFFGGNAFLRREQQTGDVQHRLTFAFLSSGYHFDNAISLPLAPIASHLYSPVYVDRPLLQKTKTGRSSTLDSRTYAFSDSIQILPEWNLLLALKNTSIAFENYDVGTGARTLDQRDTVSSPVAALSYKPHEDLTSYVSFVEGLERGGSAPATAANANEILPSILSHQLELGIKARFIHEFVLNAALFQIERDLEYLDAASNLYVQKGLQRNRGLELSYSGQVHRDLGVSGGLMLLDAEIVSAGVVKGKKPPGVPNLTFPTLLDFHMGFGLNFSLGIYHFARQYLDTGNSQTLDPWTRFDAGLKYQIPVEGSPSFFSLNVENIGNQRYWASAATGQLALGGPEIWKLAIRSEL